MTAPEPSQVQAYCQKHGLDIYIQDAAQLSLASPQDINTFMAEYFRAVLTGQHMIWRHYAYVSGTHHNRKHFLVTARRTLASRAAVGHLTRGDIHSLLLLLCPDFAASAVDAAWGPAVGIQTWLNNQQQQQQQRPGQPGPAGEGAQQVLDKVQLPIFLQCFEVTFFYEWYFEQLQQLAFDLDQNCKGLKQLEHSLGAAAQQVQSRGWPAPSKTCVKRAITQASAAGTYPDFEFAELVRALCGCQQLILDVRHEVTAATAAAAAVATALAVRSGINSMASSTSDGSNDEDAVYLHRQSQGGHKHGSVRGSSTGSNPASCKPWK